MNPGIFKVQYVAANTQSNITTRTQLTIDLANQKAKHEKRGTLYWETHPIEQAIRNQIINTIKNDYLDPIQNKYTDMINSSIPHITKYLQNIYGQLTNQELSNLEDNLKRQLMNQLYQWIQYSTK